MQGEGPGEDVLVRARVRLGQPAFASAANRLRADLRADRSRAVLVPPPDKPAGYYHDYFCPQHGQQLEFDWSSPHAHRCPVDGAVFRGDPYDRSWWWFVNHAHSDAAFRLALGWRLDDQQSCLDRLRAILAAYAAGYPQAGWPKDDPRGRQGKVTYHALDEAAWLIPLVWAYDIARPAMPAGARRDVETRLLLPAAEHLLAQRWPRVHNYMCWLNAGVGAAATLIERYDLVAQVIDGPFGFHQQIAEGVLGDGSWWEGTASYHFYTLAALLAMARSVVPGVGGAPALWRHPKLRRMFLAPLGWAYPDLSLPAINDCWYHSSLVGEVGHGIPPADAFYEIAAGKYGDPAFGAILAANYGRGRQRDSVEALLFGPDDVSPGEMTEEATTADEVDGARPKGRRWTRPRLLTASADLPEPGLVVWRGRRRDGDASTGVAGATTPGADRRTFVLLKYGQHGGGHGHPDKLGISLFSHGERMSPDLGTPGYGIALNDAWYRHTLSHNTVLIDGRSQPPATGRLLEFRPWPGTVTPAPAGGAFGLIDAEVDWPDASGVYAGARVRRRILFRPGYFIDVCTVSCPEAHSIEWAYHHCGRLTHIGAYSGAGASAPAAPAVPAVLAPSGQSATAPAGDLAVPETLRLRAVLSGQPETMAAFAGATAGLHLWLNGGAGSTAQTGGTGGTAEGTGRPPDRSSSLLAADAPDSPAAEPIALILRRQVGTRATFGAVFNPYTGRPDVSTVSWSLPAGRSGPTETLTCQISTRRGSERWEIPLAGREAPRLRLVTSRDRAGAAQPKTEK